MKIKILGSHMDVGESLTSYVEEHLKKAVKKYFDTAISAEVHFSKDAGLFKSVIVVNDGVKGGLDISGEAEAGDAYGSFNDACEKISKQLSRYKEKIKNHRREGGGLKSVEID
jgi:ribosomal subunit interface protein